MGPMHDLDTGKVHWSFFEEFNNYTDAYLYIIDEKLTDFRLIKTTWEDVTDLIDSKK
jgi:hypothetical protein